MIFPHNPPTQTRDINHAASSDVKGPSDNIVFGDCKSKKFALDHENPQPIENPSKFTVIEKRIYDRK